MRQGLSRTGTLRSFYADLLSIHPSTTRPYSCTQHRSNKIHVMRQAKCGSLRANKLFCELFHLCPPGTRRAVRPQAKAAARAPLTMTPAAVALREKYGTASAVRLQAAVRGRAVRREQSTGRQPLHPAKARLGTDASGTAIDHRARPTSKLTGKARSPGILSSSCSSPLLSQRQAALSPGRSSAFDLGSTLSTLSVRAEAREMARDWLVPGSASSSALLLSASSSNLHEMPATAMRGSVWPSWLLQPDTSFEKLATQRTRPDPIRTWSERSPPPREPPARAHAPPRHSPPRLGPGKTAGGLAAGAMHGASPYLDLLLPDFEVHEARQGRESRAAAAAEPAAPVKTAATHALSRPGRRLFTAPTDQGHPSHGQAPSQAPLRPSHSPTRQTPTPIAPPRTPSQTIPMSTGFQRARRRREVADLQDAAHTATGEDVGEDAGARAPISPSRIGITRATVNLARAEAVLSRPVGALTPRQARRALVSWMHARHKVAALDAIDYELAMDLERAADAAALGGLKRLPAVTGDEGDGAGVLAAVAVADGQWSAQREAFAAATFLASASGGAAAAAAVDYREQRSRAALAGSPLLGARRAPRSINEEVDARHLISLDDPRFAPTPPSLADWMPAAPAVKVESLWGTAHPTYSGARINATTSSKRQPWASSSVRASP